MHRGNPYSLYTPSMKALAMLVAEKKKEEEKSYKEINGIIRYKGRLCIDNEGDWREKVMREMHDS
jgi:hypothetical protein